MNFKFLESKKAYLCGPIECKSDSGKGWREDIKPSLHKFGIVSLDPLDKEGEFSLDGKPVHELLYHYKRTGDLKNFMRVMMPIIKSDIRLVDDSDFMIVNYDTRVKLSGGTISEIHHAYIKRIPMLCVTHGKKIDIPSWTLGCVLANGEIFDSFPELLKFLESGGVR